MLLLNKFDKNLLTNFFIMKICRVIAIFRSSKIFYCRWVRVQILYTVADLIPNVFMFFSIIPHIQSKIHPFSPTTITFYIFTCFWTNYTKWFNFILISVTNKAFVIFSSRRNLFKYKYVFNI